MFTLFKSKKQQEDLKEAQIIDSTKKIEKTLKLYNLRIEYNVDYRHMYKATIVYKENLNTWISDGASESAEIIGENWADLIDKVNEHFKGDQGEYSHN